MKNIIKSCFEKTDSAYADYLQLFIDSAANYKTSYNLVGVLKDKEKDYLQYLIKSYQSAKVMPDQHLFELIHEETKGAFGDAIEIPLSSLRVYIYNFIDQRVNMIIADKISELNKEIRTSGMTDEIAQQITELQSLSNRNSARDIDIDMTARSLYQRMLERPEGLKTGIKEVDDRIGGMNEGTVTTIAGFTSHFKTTWALNIAYLNSYHLGYNIAYFTLETPKQDMYWNLLSLHSYDTKFPKYNFIGHDRMRRCLLTPDEQTYIYGTIEPDLFSQVQFQDGSTHNRGRIVFLDESDFKTFSFGEITKVLEQVDDKLNGHLDAIIVDYVQLCKFSGSGIAYDSNSQINSYVTFFRRLGQSFRTIIDNNGNKMVRQLVVILLAQLNRDGWKKANKNEGKYDITALADANELERGSSRVFTTFTNEDMKARGTAQVQILKNRSGQTMNDPASVFVQPEAYLFTDEDVSSNRSFGADGQATMAAAFADMDLASMNALGL